MESLRNPTGKSFEDHTPDGRWYRIRRHRAAGGGAVTVMTDITEQKQAERAVIEAKQRLEDATSLVTEKTRCSRSLSLQVVEISLAAGVPVDLQRGADGRDLVQA